MLLAEYGTHGAFGLVVNRQMPEPAHEVITPEPPMDIQKDVHLFVGGPVEPNRAWVLTAHRELDAEALEVVDGVYLSASPDLIRHALQTSPDPHVRLVIGYAGWGAGQLDNELAASAWLMAPVQADLVFDMPLDEMWETAIRRLGAEPSALQARRAFTESSKFKVQSSKLRVRVHQCVTVHVDDLHARPALMLRRTHRDARRSEAGDLEKKIARFAPTEIAADMSALPPNERAGAGAHDPRGAGDGRAVSRAGLGRQRGDAARSARATRAPVGRARLHYFLINKGPWSRLDHNEPFIPGAPAKPRVGELLSAGRDQGGSREVDRVAQPGAEAAGDRLLHDHPPRPGRPASSPCPTAPSIRASCAIAARHLREAATLTTQPTLKAFLESRARGVSVERLLRQRREVDGARRDDRADHRSVRGVRGRVVQLQGGVRGVHHGQGSEPSRRSCRSSPASLQEIENNLPIDPKYRNPKLGALAPIAVVNTVFSAGDANRGVQTAAFNLPNDERVIREKGSKRVMLKNNQEAKFSKVLVPISQVALAAADQANVAFDAFFTHILMHELMHGLGPHDITVGGRATTVRQELKDTYSAIEEAKADVSGLFALQFLVDRGQLDKTFERTMYTTFLASAFRSIRFGINEAHGRGQAIQLNYLLDQGAFTRQRRRHVRGGRGEDSRQASPS